jgi:hypothetical protein
MTLEQLKTVISELSDRKYFVSIANPFNEDSFNLGEEGSRGMHLLGKTSQEVIEFVQSNP